VVEEEVEVVEVEIHQVVEVVQEMEVHQEVGHQEEVHQEMVVLQVEIEEDNLNY
jgi:hypothetical protein